MRKITRVNTTKSARIIPLANRRRSPADPIDARGARCIIAIPPFARNALDGSDAAMTSLIVLLVIAAVVIVAAALLLGSLTRRAARSPYRKQEYLLTTGERSFFDVLCQAISDDTYIFAKVRLSDLLRVSQGSKEWRTLQNKIQSKHIDFVLCDKATTETRLLIELDDSSHQRANRQSRDAFLDDALRGAGIPILHVTARHAYPVAELRQQILALLSESEPAAEPIAVEEGAE